MKFMESLKTKLSENRAQSSVNLYVSKLQILNGNKPFRTLSFLTDYDNITELIADKKPNTQISYLTSILVSLEHYPKYKDTKKKYQALYDDMVKMRNAMDASHQKTEREEENLIPKEDVEKVREEYRSKVKECNDLEDVSKTQFNLYLHRLVLELYTAIPPRRNQDYAYMYVVDTRPEVMEQDKNYLVMSEKKFVFNKYKTARIYGNQELVIPQELMDVIEEYLVRHPNKGEVEYPFLVNSKGKEVDKVTGIVRILNKVFNKNIGCSALRHIFITDKFGDTTKEREEIANAMAHSTSTQNKYVKL